MSANPDARESLERTAFRQALQREILVSERRRALGFAVVLAVLTCGTVLSNQLTAPYLPMMRAEPRTALRIAIYLLYIAYELTMYAAVGRRLAVNRDLSTLIRYLGALFETSLPSLVLLVQIMTVGLVAALGFNALLFYFFLIILSTLRLGFWISAFTGAVAAVEFLAIATWHPLLAESPANIALTFGFNLNRSALLLLGGVLAGWVALQLRRQLYGTLTETATRQMVTRLFGQHVSPQVVERLLAGGGSNHSELRHVAVMFVDIRGFTEAASRRDPEAVVARLDAAFSVLVAAVDRHGGIVNKFLGDGFLALFGTPLPEEFPVHSAVAAGREMITALTAHNIQHSEWPIEIGIGLHYGAVVTGNIGTQDRKEFTVIGDTVNLASRIEALNREFGVRFLVSDAVHSELGDAGTALHPLGEVAIRGYDVPQIIWRVA